MLALAKPAATTTSSTATAATMTTTLTALAVTGSDHQVRTLIPVTTTSGGRLVLAGPCILLKTSIPTVEQHLQALRPLLKADSRNRNNNNNNNNNNSVSTTTTTTATSSISVAKMATCTRIKGLRGGLKKEATPATGNEPAALRCKRRIDFGSLGLPRPLPATMARRNERERNRVKQVNLGFEKLRQHVPTGRKNRKLSKVDTLKEAATYIRHLQQLLRNSDDSNSSDGFRSVIADTIDLASRGAVLTSARTSDVTSSLQDAASPAAADELSSMVNGGATSFCVGSSSSVTSGHEANMFVDGMDFQEVDFDCEMSPMTEDEHEEEEEDDVSSITPTLTLIPEIETLTSGAPFPQLQAPLASPASPPSPLTSFVQRHDGFDYRAERWCGGSDGASCPVSPSQSSCGASETSFDESFSCSSGAPYEDFTPDLAEWLCAKFDIKEGDTFR